MTTKVRTFVETSRNISSYILKAYLLELGWLSLISLFEMQISKFQGSFLEGLNEYNKHGIIIVS